MRWISAYNTLHLQKTENIYDGNDCRILFIIETYVSLSFRGELIKIKYK